MLHIKDNSHVYDTRYTWLWLLAALESGFINSMGLLVTGNFVSHVTGFGTIVGVAAGHDSYFFVFELMIIPIAFIGGGVITSLILDKDRGDKKVPPYHRIQGLITVVLGLVYLLGRSEFMQSQMPYNQKDDYGLVETAILGLLCLSCGLKNSLVAWSTWGRIRVTHMTGLSTDIGLNLVRTLSPKWKSIRFEESRRVNLVRIMILVSFSSGALISAVLFSKIGFNVFLVIMGLSLMLTLYTFVSRLALHEKLQLMAQARARHKASAKDESGDTSLDTTMGGSGVV